MDKNGGQTSAIRHPPLKNYSPRRNRKFRRGQKLTISAQQLPVSSHLPHQVIYGRKMWFLSPPDREPKFHPDTTSLRWLLNDFDRIRENEVKPIICTCEPGRNWAIWSIINQSVNQSSIIYIFIFLSQAIYYIFLTAGGMRRWIPEPPCTFLRFSGKSEALLS